MHYLLTHKDKCLFIRCPSTAAYLTIHSMCGWMVRGGVESNVDCMVSDV